MSYICQHGQRIFNTYRECSECAAENDLYEASWAARETAEEARKQTRILENLAYQREKELEKEAAKQLAQKKIEESQQKALLAEERFRTMGDSVGALQLINKAIELEPSFIPFYRQRARYLAAQGKKEQAISDLRNFCRATPENFVEVENQLKSGKLNEFSSMKSEFEALIHQIKGQARTQAKGAISTVETEATTMRNKFKEKPAPDFVDWAENSLSKLKKSGESDSYIALLEIPKAAEEVRNEVKKASARYDDLQNRVRESLANAELKLKLISTSRGNEFASEKLRLSQNNFTEAKKLFQNPSFSKLLRCLELSGEAINDAEAGKNIIEESLARQRKSFEETLLKINDQHKEAVSSIQNRYNDKIGRYEGIEDKRERYLRKYNPSGPRGCSNLILWVVAFFIGHFLTTFEAILSQPRKLDDVILSTGLLGVIVYVIMRYLFPQIPRLAARISRIHAKRKVKELTHIRDERIDELQKGFIYNSDVISLSKKIKSLVEYESTRSSALTIAEQILNSQSNLKDNLPLSPIRKYRNIRLAKTIIYSSFSIAIIGFIAYLILKNEPNKPQMAKAPLMGIITASIANIRSEPSEKSPVYGKLALDDTVIIVSESNGWFLVKDKKMSGYKLSGYISGKLMKFHGDYYEIQNRKPRDIYTNAYNMPNPSFSKYGIIERSQSGYRIHYNDYGKDLKPGDRITCEDRNIYFLIEGIDKKNFKGWFGQKSTWEIPIYGRLYLGIRSNAGPKSPSVTFQIF